MSRSSLEDIASQMLVDTLNKSEALRDTFFDIWFSSVPDELQDEFRAEFSGHKSGNAKPDITLEVKGGVTVLVEVKLDAKASQDQEFRYRELVKSGKAAWLLYLERRPTVHNTPDPEYLIRSSWQTLENHLNDLITAGASDAERDCLRGFLDFIEVNRIAGKADNPRRHGRPIDPQVEKVIRKALVEVRRSYGDLCEGEGFLNLEGRGGDQLFVGRRGWSKTLVDSSVNRVTIAHSVKKAAARHGTPPGISIEFVLFGGQFAPTARRSDLDRILPDLVHSFLCNGIQVRWCCGKDTPESRQHLALHDPPPNQASNLVAYFRDEGLVTDKDRLANGDDWAVSEVARRLRDLIDAASSVLGR